MSSFNLSGATGRVFNLKQITKKLFLITHGTLKPVKFTATSSNVIIEDDILCDGDNCYQLIIEDGTIKLEPINEIENVLSKTKADNRMGNNYKTTEEDNDEHDAGSDFVKDFDNTAVGSDCVDDVKHNRTVENSSSDASLELCKICMDTLTKPKTIQCGYTFCTDCIDQQFQYKKQCPTCDQVCGTEQTIPGKEYVGGDRKQHKDSNDDRIAQRSLKSSSIYLNVNSKQTSLLNNDLKDNNSPTTEPASPVKNKNLDVLTTSLAKDSDQVTPILYEVAATEVKLNLKRANQTTVKQNKTIASEKQTKEENDWKDHTQKGKQSNKDKKEQFVLTALTDRVYVIQCGLLDGQFDASSTNVEIRNDFLIDGKDVYKLMIEDGKIHRVALSQFKNVSPEQTPAKHTTISNMSYAKSSHVANRPKKILSVDNKFHRDLSKGIEKISINEEGFLIEKIMNPKAPNVNAAAGSGSNGSYNNVYPKQSVTSSRHSASSTKRKTFYTKEHIKVQLYEGNILDLDVDCIVNPADKDLLHRGGIAKEIAKRAGYDLKKDCDTYLGDYQQLDVGKACRTSAGYMKYKYVIHALGPRWKDYQPITQDSLNECGRLLRSAILESLFAANVALYTVRSIAFPAISAGQLGVPKEFCCVQYAQAVIEYSKTAPSRMEIHFVDLRPEMIKMLIDTFDIMIYLDRPPSFYKEEEYIEKDLTGDETNRALVKHTLH